MNFTSINSDTVAARLARGAILPAPICNLESFKHISQSANDINNQICLTFDDGPDPDYTQRILDLLADYNVKATFFVLGAEAKKFPQLVEKMMELGHSIGNHTYSHRHPWLMSSAQAQQEIIQANTAIADITGSAPRWFRPPFGRLRTAMRKQAHAEHMATVLWSRSIIDWGVLGTKTGIARRLERIKAGDIVLMHDGKREHNRPEIMLQCLPAFLRSLSDKSLIARNLDSIA
jgi:peptidoglycan-N-acetylglucosamine deacetylase